MFNQILTKIKPSKEEELKKKEKVSEFLKIINSKLKGAKAMIGGSFAKGTWLNGEHDIDVFVLFDSNKYISEKLEKPIKSCFKKYEKIHGSRDYFIVTFKDLSFELVPVLKIKKAGDAENITDVSPMHVSWVKKNTNSKLVEDIRLAKYFMKANNCYGAETYIGGFSGYLVELLVIHYNGFMNFVKNASKWNKYTIIDIEKDNKFTSSQKFPLIVIDPVQPNRNAAAALREDKFNLFVDLCRKFIVKPSDNYLKEKKVDLKKYDLVFKATPLGGSKDVAGTKMLKAFEIIKMELEKNGFNIKDSGWFWKDYGYFYFNIKNKVLGKYKKHFGPPIKFTKDAEKFSRKHKKYKINTEKGRVFVMLPRNIININDFSKFILKNKGIKERVKDIRRITPKAI